MPLFEYQCGVCGLKFEELKGQKEESNTTPCLACKGDSVRLMSAFSPVVAGGTTNEPVDMTIGREANNRWQHYHDKQSKRHAGKEIKTFDMPKSPDGKYMPVMALGDKETVEGRKNYVGALQQHRKERVEKGLSQFKEAGEF